MSFLLCSMICHPWDQYKMLKETMTIQHVRKTRKRQLGLTSFKQLNSVEEALQLARKQPCDITKKIAFCLFYKNCCVNEVGKRLF